MKIFMITAIFSIATNVVLAQEWTRLPSLPDKEGFAGMFAGVSRGALIVAGGANFPGKKPWEGGAKVWRDTAFAQERPTGDWKIVGKLPRPIGYGVSVTHRDGVICVGGGDAARHYADVFRLDFERGKLVVTALTPLPQPLANACGALVGDVLYVAGGQNEPTSAKASNSVHRIDLAAATPKWTEIAPCPGSGRILAVASAFDGAFWLIGGADLFVGKEGKVERRWLTDAYRYDAVTGWKRIADLPRPVVAAPSPAPTDAAGVLILGGDDGSQISVAPDAHRGFGKVVLCYEIKSGRWTEVGSMPAPRVTVPCVRWNETWVVPSGEARPGIRSPEVWRWNGK